MTTKSIQKHCRVKRNHRKPTQPSKTYIKPIQTCTRRINTYTKPLQKPTVCKTYKDLCNIYNNLFEPTRKNRFVPYTLLDKYSEFFRKFGGVVLEVFETV